MGKDELIINAILDKYGSGINFYTADDILIAAGINDDQAQEILEQFKQTISKKIPSTPYKPKEA